MENSANLCRFCLKWTADYDLVPLFGQSYNLNDGEWKRLANFIYPVEGLPENMCTSCQTQINWTLAFQQQIYENELQLRMQLAMENDEGDAKFLDTNNFCDIGFLDDFNTEITEMDAENDSCQTFDAIDDKAGLQEDILHTEGHKSEELVAEVWNQLEDNKIDLGQEVMTTESETYDHETKALDIEHRYVQIPGENEKTNISECEENTPNIVKRDSSVSTEGKTRFECDCGKSFSWKTDLNKHNKTHDTKFESSLRCPDCGKKFSAKSKLTRHAKSVHQGYFYECSICGNKQKYFHHSVNHIKKEHPGSNAKPIEKCEK
jgi:predicted RNA-binding Zn-ribbon protein involved in translation (DUF1610 family)